MESEHCGHLKSDLVLIKRLFPGQPAEENGAIAVGDIILAVNGRSTEGLDFQVGGREGCSPVCGLRFVGTFLSGPPTLSEEYCGLLEITIWSLSLNHIKRETRRTYSC